MAKHSRWVITGYHDFLARVQSPTCTNHGKYLLKSIMAVLTPKSGNIDTNNWKKLFDRSADHM